MKILIYPEDIIKRCLWNNYTTYIVGNDKDAEQILLENKEFEISEENATVIGLLKVMETDNLIYRFNEYLSNFLTLKSIKEKDNLFIKKKNLDINVDKFMDKFPPYWTPPLNFETAIKELIQYINILKNNILQLNLCKITTQNGVFECYNSNAIKKLLNFNY